MASIDLQYDRALEESAIVITDNLTCLWNPDELRSTHIGGSAIVSVDEEEKKYEETVQTESVGYGMDFWTNYFVDCSVGTLLTKQVVTFKLGCEPKLTNLDTSSYTNKFWYSSQVAED